MNSPSTRMLNDPQATRCFQWITAVALAVTLAALAISAAGCANTERALKAADTAGDLNRAHEADTQLPGTAREIAQDAADAFEVIEWALGGEAPSADCQQRVNERRAERGEAPLSFE